MASYHVEVTSQVQKEIRQLPGNIRQRVWRMLQTLKEQPRPENSKTLDLSKTGLQLASTVEILRIRMDVWRVIYVVEEEIRLVSILAIRRRPPYQYEDIEKLLRMR